MEEGDSNRKKKKPQKTIIIGIRKYGIQSKVMDPKQSSAFQDPSSSNSLHIVLTRVFYFYKS